MSECGFMTYVLCECEIWQNEQSVGAAEAQDLTVDTLSFITGDLELSTNTTRKPTVRAKSCFLKRLCVRTS